MDTKELEKIIDQKNQTFLDKLLTIFKPTVKAIMVTDANGNQIEFPDVPEGGVVKVGDKTTAPDGKVVMATGEIYVIKGGVLSEIIPVEAAPAAEQAPNAELEALKAENEALKKQLTEASAKIEEIESIKAQLATFKSQMVTTTPLEAGQKTVTNRFV